MGDHEVIVVGSGATGTMAAQTLLESGSRVTVVDVGKRDAKYAGTIPAKAFASLRQTDRHQHRYFLGEEFESLAMRGVKAGAQLTPPRKYVVEDVQRLLPYVSDTFVPVESLAVGGLASTWGLACAVFSPSELKRASLSTDDMRDAYTVVASRIGISGEDDDARPYTWGHLDNIQPALTIDPTAALLLKTYARKRSSIRASGFRLGRPALALLSQARDGREASGLDDMEFYSDRGHSAWRAALALERLERFANFRYMPDRLVLRFEEGPAAVHVFALNTRAGEIEMLRCRTLVLCAGALGSARIVLRSGPDRRSRLPLLCNPYTYIPAIVPARLGRAMPDNNTALSQLAMFFDPDGMQRDVTAAQVYSYRSLLLFRLIREVPLPMRAARSVLRFLISAFLIVGVHHPHENDGESSIHLEPDPDSPTADRLAIDFRLSAAELARVRERERKFAACLYKLGAVPVKRVNPGFGSSIHYAGTLPISKTERSLTTSPEGRLHGTKHVYVADGSAFTFLPAKGLTLSLMARAHVVARHVAENV